MNKRSVAASVLIVLFLATSVPAVALVEGHTPLWLFFLFFVISVLAAWLAYRVVRASVRGDSEGRVMDRAAIEGHAQEIAHVCSLIRAREFRPGRFSVGYRAADVDKLLAGILRGLENEEEGIDISRLSGKLLPWAIRTTGYRQEDVDELLNRVRRELERICDAAEC